MPEISNTINRYVLDEIINQIFVRELIEATIGYRLTWSRLAANQFIVVCNELDAQWRHILTFISSGGSEAPVYSLDSFMDDEQEFSKNSAEVSEIADLWRTVSSNFAYLSRAGGVTLRADGDRSAVFRSADGEFLSITHEDQSGLSLDGSFTICVWCLVRNLTATRNIIHKGGNYRIYFDNSDDRIKFEIETTTGTETVSADEYGDVDYDTWLFIQAWYDADAGRIWVNVNRAATNEDADSTSGLTEIEPGDEDFIVGQDWEGRICKLAIFRGIVSDVLADRMYNNGDAMPYSRLPRNKLIAYWEMNEEFGTRYDSAGRFNHLIVNTDDPETFEEGIVSGPGVADIYNEIMTGGSLGGGLSSKRVLFFPPLSGGSRAGGAGIDSMAVGVSGGVRGGGTATVSTVP